jgi:hypothetical protein
MIGANSGHHSKPDQFRREPEMQAAVEREHFGAETPARHRALFERFWEDVAPFNNYSPEAARALLAAEIQTQGHVQHDVLASDPWAAVRAALAERAAGRKIIRIA